MKRILNFVKLDFLTIKPYITIKSLLIMIVVGFALTYSNGSQQGPKTMAGMGGIAALGAFIMMFVSYPFAVGDRNGIDALYIILGISRKEVVQGRYLWSFLMNFLGLGISVLVSMTLLPLVMNDSSVTKGLIIASIALYYFFSISQMIQLTLFFKLGYTKAKYASYLPFLLMLILMFLSNTFKTVFINAFSFILGKTWFLIGIALVVWILAAFVSYKISEREYSLREF